MSKHILVLARRDAYEALRVAAGLTIRNNTVDFVFMCDPPRTETGAIAHRDMLTLAEITPQTYGITVPDIPPLFGPHRPLSTRRPNREFLIPWIRLKKRSSF